MNRAWRATTADDIEAGFAEYQRYQDTLRLAAQAYGTSLERTALAFVILSPNVTLRENMTGLIACLQGVKDGRDPTEIKVRGFHKNRNRAVAALRGDLTLADIGGRKIRSFYDNILYPWSSPMVTVDGHMLNIALGGSDDMTGALFHAREYTHDRVYTAAEDAVRHIARRERVPAPGVQASIWIRHRAEHGKRVSEFPSIIEILQEVA